ncbi:MAG: hypothetical protein ACE5KE_04075 [Methanosarcinales archaeon]
MELNKKVKDVFHGLFVNKKYTQKQEISKMPRFISEYLISRYGDEEGNISENGVF